MAKETKQIRKGPKVISRIILLSILIPTGFFGFNRINDNLRYCSTDDASIDGKSVNISSKMLGRISKIMVSEGSDVKEGDILVLLDNSDLKAQEAQALSSLNYAKKNLDFSTIGLTKAKDDFNRLNNLYKNGAATKESYEHAQNAVDSAIAQYNLVNAQIETSTAQLGVITSQLNNTIIKSTISGKSNNIEYVTGDVVQPSQNILTVNDLSDIWVVANIKETEINKVKIGADVIITIDALPKKEFHGVVSIIQSGIVPPAFQIGEFTKTVQRIPVRIKFINLEEDLEGEFDTPLLPKMSVEVKISTAKI